MKWVRACRSANGLTPTTHRPMKLEDAGEQRGNCKKGWVMPQHVQVRLKPRKAAPFFGRHPWVLASAIDRIEGEVVAGDVVDLVAENGDFIARGIINPESRIRVRLYTWQRDETLEHEWWQQKLSKACELRREMGLLTPDGACRLVNSEADGVSGLIVDRFSDYLVIQPTSLAVWRRLDSIASILQAEIGPKGIVLHSDPQINRREGINAVLQPTWGESPNHAVTILEDGLRFQIDLGQSQKTGFYLDQRNNRRAASHYFRGKTVADVCCYSGGFSIFAEKRGEASRVIGVDASQSAIDLAQQHADLNECERCEFEKGDCFKWLDGVVERQEHFGAVILDPPKFASGRKGVSAALRAYHRLNLQAIKAIETDGILVTCSCTGSVHREEFIDTLHGAAVRAKRTIQILENRGAAPDHPVGTHCRENDYLKCLICRVL